MNKKEIIKGNKLIAEFMGAEFQYYTDDEEEAKNSDKKYTHGTPKKIFESCDEWWRCSFNPEEKHFGWKFPSDLYYHNDWNWLMPVIEKIEEDYSQVFMEGKQISFEDLGECGIYYDGYETVDIEDGKLQPKNKDLIKLETFYRGTVEAVKCILGKSYNDRRKEE